MTTEMLARVSEGAKWMDRHRPGWADRIDTDALDLQHCHKCVIGQIVSSYWAFVGRYQEDKATFHRNEAWAVQHGFSMPYATTWPDPHISRWKDLREAWITEVLARRFAALPQDVKTEQPVAVTA